jgi:hypothetical protein
MGTEADRREAAQAAGERYGAMAADLSLMHVNSAADEDVMEERVQELARNIREQALQQVSEGTEKDLALVWEQAALEAAQIRLAAFGAAAETTQPED